MVYDADILYNNLDEEGREVNSIGPKVLHVGFHQGRNMTIFDRLRLRQMEMLGLMDGDYDSDADFSSEDGLEGDFFDAPTPSQLSDEAAELRAAAAREAAQKQKVASKPEQAKPAPVKEEPPQDAAD